MMQKQQSSRIVSKALVLAKQKIDKANSTHIENKSGGSYSPAKKQKSSEDSEQQRNINRLTLEELIDSPITCQRQIIDLTKLFDST
jgi:hypothetical protein